MLITLKIPNYLLHYAGMNLSIMLQEQKKYLRGNNTSFMTKALPKSIMERTCLRNNFLKNPIVANKLAYTKKLKAWRTTKPFLSVENKSREKISLKKEKITSNDIEVENTFNSYFSNVVKNLKIPDIFVTDSLPQSLSRHPTLNAIWEDVKILKENVNFFADYIYLQFNEAIESSKFADFFKSADISAAFKQGSQNKKENYSPISILSLISKLFEKIICRQLSNHFDKTLSKFQCSFRKGYSPQHYLLLMVDKWKKAVDHHKVFGTVLTDLSKAFDCICHDLLIAKLNAYGLYLPALKPIIEYLQNQKQWTKTALIYSDW